MMSESSENDDTVENQPTIQSKMLPIPKIFQSVESGGLFTTCLQCGRNLIDSGELYVIEKVFRRFGDEKSAIEPIIEMAMCLVCRDSEGQSMSGESARAIQQYFEQNVDFERRITDLAPAGQDSDSVDLWLDRCLLNGQSLDEIREFQVMALCNGSSIQRDFFPIMISGAAIEHISSLLSEQTRGWMDDFIGDNFGMPSEFCESPSFTPVFI